MGADAVITFIPLQYQFLAKFIVLLALAASAAFGAWYVTSNHYEGVIAQHALNDAEAVKAELLRQQKLLTERAEQTRLAEEQHAKDQLTINNLAGKLSRVQVNLPKCGGAVPGAGQASANPDGTGGLAAARADEYLAAAQREIQDIGQRCAQLNIDAIAANNKQLNNTVKP